MKVHRISDEERALVLVCATVLNIKTAVIIPNVVFNCAGHLLQSVFYFGPINLTPGIFTSPLTSL